MATLDTTGVYTAGDDYRVIKVLELPVGSYTFNCVAGCMNDLEAMSSTAASDLVTLLGDWETADAAQSTDNLTQTDGKKVLVKADVLEWEVTGGGMSGPVAEKGKIQAEIAQIMSFCSCIGGFLNGYGTTGTCLIRS